MNTVLSEKTSRHRVFPLISRKNLLFGVVFTVSLCFLTHPQATKSAVTDALYFCFSTLIPSLFPFALAGEVLVLSGFGNFLGRHASAFLLGALCGFPIGGKTALSYYESGEFEKGEAELISAACNNAGAGFVIAGIGSAMWQDTGFGVALYAVQLISAIMTAYALKPFFIGALSAPKARDNVKKTSSEASVSDIISHAVPNAVTTMLKVCGFVVLFELLLSLVPIFIKSQAATLIASVLLEITSGVSALLRLSVEPANELLAKIGTFFAVGFGGLSVYMQFLSFVGKRELSTGRYIIFKLIQAVICSAIGAFLLFFGIL